MPLQTAASAFCLGRWRWSSQQCHLHCLRTFIYSKTALYKTLQSLTAVLWLVRAVSAVILSITVEERRRDAPARVLTPELIFTTCCQCSHHHELVVMFSQLHPENTTISETHLIATMCFMSRPSSMKSSIVLCYTIKKLTYLLTASRRISGWTGCTFIVRMLYHDVYIDFYLATFYLNIPEVTGLLKQPGF